MTLTSLCESGGEPVPAAFAQRLGGWLPGGFAMVTAGVQSGHRIVPAERALVQFAAPARQASFITGRWCAHRALEVIGRPVDLLPVGPLGSPQWPRGVIGSITHDGGWCLAVAGPQAAVQGIGIDLSARSRRSILPALAPLIHSASEARRFAALGHRADHLQALFCIKEAVVKAVSGLAGRYLDLRDIDVHLHGERFEASIAGLPWLAWGLHGIEPGHVLALALCGESQAVDSRPS